MGNYIFTTKVLIDAIRADADDDHSDHDMGGDIIPRLVDDGMAAVYDVFSNALQGLGVSLEIAFLSVLIAGVIGSLGGIIAGFFGKWTSAVIMLGPPT